MNATEALREMRKLFGINAGLAVGYDCNSPGVVHYLVGRTTPTSGPIIGWKKNKKWKPLPAWSPMYRAKHTPVNRKDYFLETYGWGGCWQEAVADALLEVMEGNGRGRRSVFTATRSKAHARPILKVDLTLHPPTRPPSPSNANRKNYDKHLARYSSTGSTRLDGLAAGVLR
jgi:hypothetical protein